MRSVVKLFVGALVPLVLASLPASAQSATPDIRVEVDSNAAARFAGCYRLTLIPDGDYQLRLTLGRVGAAWDAQVYGPGARNSAGDSWIWAPTSSTTFRIAWGGVDSAMEFRIARDGAALVASGIEYSGTPVQHTRFNARVRRVACPSPEQAG